MLPEEQKWDRDLIIDLFNARDGDLILNIPLRLNRKKDRWYWAPEIKEQHTVKSSYRGLLETFVDTRANLWVAHWKLRIPLKVQSFRWRTLQGVLPTTDNLRGRMVPVQQLCPVCANE